MPDKPGSIQSTRTLLYSLYRQPLFFIIIKWRPVGAAPKWIEDTEKGSLFAAQHNFVEKSTNVLFSSEDFSWDIFGNYSQFLNGN